MGKPFFTDGQYRYARDEVNALEYARAAGYALKKEGSKYRMAEHDSMVFTEDGRWFWNSRGLRGGAIEFLMAYEGKTLPEAVLTLCNAQGQTYADIQANTQKSLPPPTKKPARASVPFVLPPKAGDSRRVIAYLTVTRAIDREIVIELIRRGAVYQSCFKYKSKETGKTKEVNNAVFVAKDKTGVPRSAFQRGMNSVGKVYKTDAAGSDESYPFVLKGLSGDTVVVFESAIDALSHATIYKQAGLSWRNVHRLATGGCAKSEGLLRFLDENKNIKRIELAFDADEGGEWGCRYLRSVIPNEYEVEQISVPYGKDWNEYLIMIAQRLKLNAWRPADVVGRIYYVDEKAAIQKVVFFTDIEQYKAAAALALSKSERVVFDPTRRTMGKAPYQAHRELTKRQ